MLEAGPQLAWWTLGSLKLPRAGRLTGSAKAIPGDVFSTGGSVAQGDLAGIACPCGLDSDAGFSWRLLLPGLSTRPLPVPATKLGFGRAKGGAAGILTAWDGDAKYLLETCVD